MGSVRRLYVEKKKEFAVEAEKLAAEIKNYLGLTNVSDVRVVVRYDVENILKELLTVYSLNHLLIITTRISSKLQITTSLSV